MPLHEVVFVACNNGVLLFWLALVFAPRTRLTERLVHSGAFAWVLVPAYALMIFGDRPGPEGASFLTLEGVMRIFTTPQTVDGCWIHYLVFDLFVGAWEARDARRIGFPHALLVPCLALTLMFGPVGLGLYLGLRALRTRRVTLAEA
jgi:hypothetical protein